jgi:hypothetical protein
MGRIVSESRLKLILRLAAAIATIQATAHLALFLRSQPKPGAAIWPLAEAMRAMAVAGHTNFWKMYFGYGLLSAVTAFLVAALIWLAATFDEGSRDMARRLVGFVLIAVVAHAVLIWEYFFVLPLLFDGVVAVLLALGWRAFCKVAPPELLSQAG